jgi:hypothetical protein
MIVFSCQCGQTLRAKEETAGKKSKCPHCGTMLTIPVGVVASAFGAAAAAGEPEKSAWDWNPPSAGGDDPPASAHSMPVETAAAPTAQPAPTTQPEPPAAAAHPKKYKLYSQSTKGFSGKFDLNKLEDTLNECAASGWLVKSAVTMSVPTHGGTHEELLVILERGD